MAQSARKPEDSANQAGRPQTPEQCRKCAMLTMPEVHALHGAEGDGCYEPKVCRSRRSHARKAEQNNYKRRIQHQQKKLQSRTQEQTLQQFLALPWIELWLGLLLGGYQLERRGEDFYAGEIWVHRLPATSKLEP